MPDPISWSLALPYFAAAFVASYLIGSIPFGLVVTRLAGLGDIRRIGSGNIGATNVLRTGNKGLAGLTLLLDGGKGLVAVLLGQRFGPDIAVIAALGAVLGHLFPVWLRFRGGKGVATTLGALLGLAPLIGLLACATWLAVAVTLRYSSLAALVAIGLAPVYAYLSEAYQVAEIAGLLAILVWLRHHANIRRLLRGEEPRIGRRSA